MSLTNQIPFTNVTVLLHRYVCIVSVPGNTNAGSDTIIQVVMELIS